MTGILFDLDGTLLDTLEDLADATNYTLARFGCPPRSLEEVRCFVGNGALRLMELALPGHPTDPDPREALAVFQPYYKANSNHKTRPYEGIREALEALGKHYPIAIVTNKPHAAAATLCQAHFPGIITLGEQPGCPRKPAADMIVKAMEQLGADRCVYVGDSEVDILTAQNAGVPCLSVTWGLRTVDQLTAAGASHFCRHPAELPGAIGKIIRGNKNGK